MHLRHMVVFFLEINKAQKEKATKIPLSNLGKAESGSRSKGVSNFLVL